MIQHFFHFQNRYVLIFISGVMAALASISYVSANSTLVNFIPDTGQVKCYSSTSEMAYPETGESFYGQDAQYQSNPMAYQDNGDGSITDLITGLMWSKAVNETKVSLEEAHSIAAQMTLGGYTDWRVPNIKELYSLMNFQGNTGTANGNNVTNAIPFIDTDYFDFRYGNTASGERYIDAQWLSATKYVSTTMNGAQTLFGVNFADGRIKGYGYFNPNSSRGEKKFYARYVRGNAYGGNDFTDNGDGTVTDNTTGLMWMKTDSIQTMDWGDALVYAEDATFAGYTDWRLPNAKELQFIVDYQRSPDTTDSPAIDPVFDTSSITNEAGQKDYPYYWTSTTHLEGPRPGVQGVYISFGRAMGQMNGKDMDVHGAGAQRSDPKSGQGNFTRGPQGDWIRVYNFVRLVRGGTTNVLTSEPTADETRYPYQVNVENPDALTTGSSSTSNRGMTRPHMNQNQGQSYGRPQGLGIGQMQGAQGQGMPQGFINRLDVNGDGRISRDEFDGPADHFTMFDKNSDGYITEDEAPTGPPPEGGRRAQ